MRFDKSIDRITAIHALLWQWTHLIPIPIPSLFQSHHCSNSIVVLNGYCCMWEQVCSQWLPDENTTSHQLFTLKAMRSAILKYTSLFWNACISSKTHWNGYGLNLARHIQKGPKLISWCVIKMVLCFLRNNGN